GARVVHDDDGPAHAAISHERVAAQSEHGDRLLRRQLAQERGEVVAIRGGLQLTRRPAAAPSRMTRERRADLQRAAERGELARLVHHHAAASKVGGCPMEPAPIVTTTSPSRTTARIASATSAIVSTNTGSTRPATRTARTSARPSAATIGSSPAGYTSTSTSTSTVDSTLTKAP